VVEEEESVERERGRLRFPAATFGVRQGLPFNSEAGAACKNGERRQTKEKRKSESGRKEAQKESARCGAPFLVSRAAKDEGEGGKIKRNEEGGCCRESGREEQRWE
jgi:hypothetical protein